MQSGGCGGGGCGGGRGFNGGRPAIPGGIHGGGCGGGGCGGGGNGRPGPRPIAEDPITPPGLDPNGSSIREPSPPAEPPSPIEEPEDLVPAPAVDDDDGGGPVWPNLPSPFDEVSPAPPNGAEGARLFTQSCSGCHQNQKEVIGPFDSWGKEEWGRSITQIEQEYMPPERNALTPEQRGSIVEYLRQKINE